MATFSVAMFAFIMAFIAITMVLAVLTSRMSFMVLTFVAHFFMAFAFAPLAFAAVIVTAFLDNHRTFVLMFPLDVDPVMPILSASGKHRQPSRHNRYRQN